jgi:nitronate monooxygenase
MSQSRRDFLGHASALGAALQLAPAADAQPAASAWLSNRTKALLSSFGMDVPIVQAGFGASTSVRLAAAVSNAGGMGAIGALNAQNAKDRVTALAAATKRSFFVNMILQQFPTNPPNILPICLDAGARIIQFSWGLPSAEGVRVIRAAGARFGVQIASREAARAALDGDADFLICQGTEAGGHVQAHRGLYEILPTVLEVARDRPVLAAGGIADGAGIYKALAAGASGAVLGTRFVATRESDAHDDYKKALTGAKGSNTSLTLCFQNGWLAQHRVLRNSTFVAWEAAGCPQAGTRPGEGDVIFTRGDGRPIHRYDNNAPLVGCQGRVLEASLYAGKGADAITDLPPAADLIQRLWAGAEAAHRSAG